MIAVDICNTLADVNTVLEKYFGKINWGEYLHPCVRPDFFRKNPDIFREAQPFQDAAKELRKIAQKERIIYVTARPPEADEATKWFLSHYNFPRADIIYTTNKVDIAALTGISKAIDDSPLEIVKYKQAGIPVAVFRQHYNREFANRFRWGEAISYEI